MTRIKPEKGRDQAHDFSDADELAQKRRAAWPSREPAPSSKGASGFGI